MKNLSEFRREYTEETDILDQSRWACQVKNKHQSNRAIRQFWELCMFVTCMLHEYKQHDESPLYIFTFTLVVGVHRRSVMSSDLHEEACQQGSLDVEGVGSGTEGGH